MIEVKWSIASAPYAVEQSRRPAMDILSTPAFMIVPFAIWIGLIAVALSTLAAGGDTFAPPLRSARETLDEHLARGDIGR
ncbi:MAG: hypothetical protein AB7P22_14050, partial [Vicinamibacterales bacterium]